MEREKAAKLGTRRRGDEEITLQQGFKTSVGADHSGGCAATRYDGVDGVVLGQRGRCWKLFESGRNETKQR